MSDAQAKLAVLKPWLQQFKIHAVGNSHIDMAWLWPWTETVEVVRNTFQSVLDLMREYPDFTFTMSSARTYEWIEEKYPEMFKQISERVREGRWEVIGGMWVEPDLNMPDGESLTRQILVGKRYFQGHFGVDVKIGWNPDSFGYNAQGPQIYKKSGMDYFVARKLLWAHEFTTFPYKLFWWQAPDGSRLLTYFPHDYAGGIEGPGMAKDLSVWAPSIYGPTVKDSPEIVRLYGVGDHGGGPTRVMLDSARALSSPDVVYPKFELGTATAFFKELDKKLPDLKVPTWNGELYFQYHRGVFTTQAETKQRIRRSEEVMLNAEKFASLALLDGRAYPQEQMNRAWKRLLFDDFHDIMPGSGIGVNYLDARRNLEDVRLAGDRIRGRFAERDTWASEYHGRQCLGRRRAADGDRSSRVAAIRSHRGEGTTADPGAAYSGDRCDGESGRIAIARDRLANASSPVSCSRQCAITWIQNVFCARNHERCGGTLFSESDTRESGERPGAGKDRFAYWMHDQLVRQAG